MITLLLISIAAFMNAVMDRVENENFYGSIFRNKDEKFWYKKASWKYAKKICGYKIDAWHLAKSAMIVCLLSAIYIGSSKHEILSILFNMCIAGITWNIVFNFSYNFLLKSKT